jgi:hypothetical protein
MCRGILSDRGAPIIKFYGRVRGRGGCAPSLCIHFKFNHLGGGSGGQEYSSLNHLVILYNYPYSETQYIPNFYTYRIHPS